MILVNARSCAQAHKIVSTLSITSWPQLNFCTSVRGHCVVMLFVSMDVLSELELAVIVEMHPESG